MTRRKTPSGVTSHSIEDYSRRYEQSRTSSVGTKQHGDSFQNLVGNPEQIDMSLDRLLKTFSFFHVVKRLEEPWSNEVQFVCSCPDFYKNGTCEHATICTMLVDKTVQVPGGMAK
jgi:hypothetical protein